MVDTLTSETMDAAHDPFGVTAGDIAPNRCTECGKGFEVPSGPGRKSKKCPDCRTGNSGKSSTASNTANSTANAATAAKLEKSINGMAAMTAMLMATRSPSDSAIIVKKTPAFAKAMGVWGAENKTVKKYIEGGANSLAAVTVMFTLFDLVWSLLANHGIVPGGGNAAPNLSVVRDMPTAASGTYFTTEGS